MASFHEYFSNSKAFDFHEGLFYQIGFRGNSEFEKEYLPLREQEGRLYSDEIVKKLPALPKRHPLHNEWTIRKQSADRLIGYLKKKRIRNILEVGCGNGWLTSYLFNALQVECCGIDINETELKQAARLFAHDEKITFVYAGIHSPAFAFDSFADIIVLASVIQYFPDLHILLTRLKELVGPGGEIHIIDSPLYKARNVGTARKRSVNYFNKSSHKNMEKHYYHHTWKPLGGFKYEVLYNPRTPFSRLKNLVSKGSPFPWVKVTF